MSKKIISIVTPCYNEEANIVLMINKIKTLLLPFDEKYDFEIIIIR